jgi:hypothetical protein
MNKKVQKIENKPLKDEKILSAKPQDWKGFLQIANSIKVADNFMSERDNSSPQKRDLYDG